MNNQTKREIEVLINDMASYVDAEPAIQRSVWSWLTLHLPAKLEKQAKQLAQRRLGLEL